MRSRNEKIAIVGLGYVGLPVAIALAKKFEGVIGFDVAERRVTSLRAGVDWTGEVSEEDLAASDLMITADPEALSGASFLIVTVPTPIDDENRPDLRPIESACALLGKRLSKGALVVFESTVYPGVTDDICGPLIEGHSGLKRGRDFFLGYSPERINPGDHVHRLETIVKIVAAEDSASLARVRAVYGAIIEAGLHEAPSIRVAEAAKVIENVQRDVNIALMNELSLIFDRMGIATRDVLDAARTKWNFLPFSPGLVGGHCIGVDPYYLTSAAQKLGYHPEVILSGRRINDNMPIFVADRAVQILSRMGTAPSSARVGLLGITFKENVPDIRNSKVPDIVSRLRDFSIEPLIHDPFADPAEVEHEYGLRTVPFEDLKLLDLLIVAVGHQFYLDRHADLVGMLGKSAAIFDVKNALQRDMIPAEISYWSL